MEKVGSYKTYVNIKMRRTYDRQDAHNRQADTH